MNKYEQWLEHKRTLPVTAKQINVNVTLNGDGGWNDPVCLQCAVSLLERLGACPIEHMNYIRRTWGPGVLRSYPYASFYSTDGNGLIYNDRMPPRCGCNHE